MSQVIGKALRFQCRLISAFHSTRQEYASLWKCAPFILGSTLRGALLHHLISTRYSASQLNQVVSLTDPLDIADFHRSQDETGLVRPFFTNPPEAIVSFGMFRKEAEIALRGLTRIALERADASVSPGAIVNVEAISPGSDVEPTRFDFEILLPGDNGTLAEGLEQAVREFAEVGALGKLRSVGLGRFAIDEPVEIIDLWDRVLETEFNPRLSESQPKLTLQFATPYILLGGMVDAAGLVAAIREQWPVALEHAGYVPEGESLSIQNIDAQVQPEFIGRWSFERSTRENRLAAWPGSRFTLELADIPPDIFIQFAITALFGLGEWSEMGFGRFEIISDSSYPEE